MLGMMDLKKQYSGDLAASSPIVEQLHGAALGDEPASFHNFGGLVGSGGGQADLTKCNWFYPA